ncbi:MAG: hypothetical protein JST00_25345 [Deltaproteobacteria bacterium]|nr:hypothetical protein [Deltaproteobacteria bacterium]
MVVSKVKRYHAMDAQDVEAMIRAGHASHAAVVNAFLEAVDWFSMDARAEELPRYVENLHRVERDIFGVDETEIDLPE